MRVLITGASGQLGREFEFLAPKFPQFQFTFKDKNELDICDLKACEREIPPNFDAVINAAAYTAVDRAESERERAFAVNEKGVANLAKVCKIGGARLIHISTDYVFSGEFSAPIKTDTLPSPINAYGESKLGGERAILAADLQNCAIIRTSWLYGAFGGNFVKTIARHALEKTRFQWCAISWEAPQMRGIWRWRCLKCCQI